MVAVGCRFVLRPTNREPIDHTVSSKSARLNSGARFLFPSAFIDKARRAFPNGAFLG
jgi:hypothetical protein